MANYVYILKKGMDATPGSKDESAVAPDQRLGEEVPLVSEGARAATGEGRGRACAGAGCISGSRLGHQGAGLGARGQGG